MLIETYVASLVSYAMHTGRSEPIETGVDVAAVNQ